ncbi:MAG: hypothetical protein MUE46_15235 [Xanthomonadales bacterium]|jgi:hypothetical protein|nr:hypothetical protein [Xanthomonadales bacterium]
MDWSLEYLGALTLCVACSHALGSLLQRLIPAAGELPSSLRILSGSMLMIALYAVYRCGGQSIFLLALPLLWIAVRQPIGAAAAGQRLNILPGMILSLLFAFGLFKFRYGFDPTEIRSAWIDDFFYARLAQALSLNGIENSHIGSHFEALPPSPYHYLELWATALIADLLHLNYYQTLRLVVTPFFFFVFILILADAVTSRSALVRYAAGLLCSSGLLLVLPPNDIPYLRNLDNDLFAETAPKALPAVTLFAAGSIAALRNRLDAALAWFALCALASFAMFGVVAGMFAAILWQRVTGPAPRHAATPMLAVTLLLAIPAFYLLINAGPPGAATGAPSLRVGFASGMTYLKYALPGLLLLAALTIFIHASGNRAAAGRLIGGLVVGALTGLLVSISFPGEKDASQFFKFALDCALRSASAVLRIRPTATILPRDVERRQGLSRGLG